MLRRMRLPALLWTLVLLAPVLHALAQAPERPAPVWAEPTRAKPAGTNA